MEGSLAAFGTAIWLGILMSISPCPLASNIAALSYLSKNVQSRKAILISGASYTLGRIVAYVVTGALLIAGLITVFSISHFLQTWTNRFIGPLLILLGFVLLEWLRIPLPTIGSSERLERLARGGWPGAASLGLIFALSFCPISAALFFGSLIPLSVERGSIFLIPGLFGLGTAAPVAVFAVMIALGARSIGKTYERITLFAFWAKRITGVVFLLAGVYYIVTYWFGVSVWG